MRGVVVGLDIGTSSLKAAAVAEDGSIAEFLTRGYEIPSGWPQGVVPAAVYETAVKRALANLSRSYELLAVGVTTQMYSLCQAREDGLAVWQWNCLWKRDADTERAIGADLIRSGCRPDTLYPAYKLASLPPERRKSFLPYGVKEYLIYTLCGELGTDYSTACASGLFDAVERKWNLDLAARLGYSKSDLPRVFRHDAPAGQVLPAAFEGASGKTLVVPGLGDGPAASLACRGLSSFCGNLGTSMAARVLTDRPDFSDKNGLWNLAVDETQYAVGGVSSNSCTVLHWAERLGLKIPERLSDSGSVRFYPWLYGERSPYWSSDLRAVFTGLSAEDGPEAVSSAVCKAVAFTFARITQAVELAANPDDPLVLLGGGTNFPALLSAVTGCVDREILLPRDETYLGAMGAAVSACRAAGIEYIPQLKVSGRHPPTGKYRAEYEEWSRRARELVAQGGTRA